MEMGFLTFLHQPLFMVPMIPKEGQIFLKDRIWRGILEILLSSNNFQKEKIQWEFFHM